MFVFLGILAFLIVLVVTVVLHEGGHMTVAKLFGLKVPRFFAGFGPTMWSKKKNGTEYGIKALPFGGFVEIMDSSREDDYEKISLSYVSPWKRILVYIAGPMVNIVVGSVLFIGAFLSIPVAFGSNVVDNVSPIVMNARQVDQRLLVNDKITDVNGVQTNNVEDIKKSIKLGDNDITVVRNGEQIKVVVPTTKEVPKLGITVKVAERKRTLTESIAVYKDYMGQVASSLVEFPEIAAHSIASFGQPYQENDTKRLSSVVKIGEAYTDAVEPSTEKHSLSVFSKFIYITAAFNMGLGVVNLLPILPLDGGRVVVALADSAKNWYRRAKGESYQPVSSRIVNVATIIMFTVVVLFSVALIISDTITLF